MKIKAIIAALSLLLLASCGGSGTESRETVKIGGKYLIELPSYLEKTTGLNDDASLEYQNGLKELYIVVIDESKTALQKILDENEVYDVYSNDLEGYTRLVTLNFESGLGLDSLPPAKNLRINGLPAKELSFEGRVEGLDIYYKMALVEGKNTYYQIMSWTLSDRKETHEATMQEMISSFRETDKSKY